MASYILNSSRLDLWCFHILSYFVDNDDMKRRMYSCILVVGGGLMFSGAQSWLQYTIWTQMPPHIRMTLDVMDVITRPKVRMAHLIARLLPSVVI